MSEIGQENGVKVNKLVKQLKRFFKGDEKKTQAAIEALLSENPHLSAAEIYRVISTRGGKRKSHVSGKYKEGEMYTPKVTPKRRWTPWRPFGPVVRPEGKK